MNAYETDELLHQYLAFHYGDEYFGVGNYPARCAALCRELMRERPRRAALDLGCAVGRASFELARDFDRVTGVDLSRRFVDSAATLKREGRMAYFLPDEGELGHWASANLATLDLETCAGRVDFVVADACDLGEAYHGYDLILAGNLIDRLADPRAFLTTIHRHLAQGGVLVISSPYTLMEAYTPRANWIGGFRRDGHPVTVLDGMTALLGEHFVPVQAPVDLPFVIRETRRKFQHTIAQATAWRRVH